MEAANHNDPCAEDIGLGGNVATGPIALQHSATDGAHEGVVFIYTHGISARVEITSGASALKEGLLTGGFGVGGAAWVQLHRSESAWKGRLRGSVWLTGRAPGTRQNKQSPLAQLRRRLGVALFALDVDLEGEVAHLNLQTVRQEDVGRVLEGLGLEGRVVYLRRLERYIVLTPADAKRLGKALGETPRYGRGREKAKFFFVNDYQLPIVVGSAKHRTATLKVYRVGPGATSLYRMEVTLAGRTNQRGNFAEADVEKIDELLLGLVDDHALHPVPKPTRWEPVAPTAKGLAPRDGLLRQLRPTAWRGGRVRDGLRRAVWEGHIPPTLEIASSTAESSQTEPVRSSARIRYSRQCLSSSSVPNPSSESLDASTTQSPSDPGSTSPASAPTSALAPAIYMSEGAVGPAAPSSISSVFYAEDPLASMVDEIERLPGVYEIVLDDGCGPASVIRLLTERFGTEVGFVAIGHQNMWASVERAEADYPLRNGQKVMVACLDPSYLAHFHAAFATDDLQPGPLMRHGFARLDGVDPSFMLWQGMAGALAALVEQLREEVETTGSRFVFITQDARPARGRASWSRAQAWTDARVRSTLGDAGRRSAHCRYFIDTDPVGRVREVVAWKDEHEGLMGRVLFSAAEARSTRILMDRRHPTWRRAKRNNSTETPSIASLVEETT